MSPRPIAALAIMASIGAAHAQERIAVYSAGPAVLINSLAKSFTAKSGVTVDVFQGTTGQIMARIEAEAGRPRADVLISASWDTAEDFAKRGWILPYAPPDPETIPQAMRTSGAVAEGVSGLAIAWRPTSAAPRPEDWPDLASADYKDQVTIPDPAQSGSSFELMAALQARYGWSLFKSLRAQGAVVSDANAQALNAVLQGAKAAVFGAVDYISYGAKAKGEAIDVIFPRSGTVVAPRPMMIFKWSKYAAAAKKFLDFVLSDEGQAIVARSHLMPARNDAKADRPLLKDIRLLPVPADAYARRKDLIAGFDQALGRR